jgi:hypothetical protein
VALARADPSLRLDHRGEKKKMTVPDHDHPPETIPEASEEEPRILTPEQDASRATRRSQLEDAKVGAGIAKPQTPMPADPLRQGGESSPAPGKRR